MTVKEALQAELNPYTIEDSIITKVLVDVNLDSEKEYDISDRAEIAKAAVFALSPMLALKSESQGSYTIVFDAKMLSKRIADLCDIAGLESSEYTNQAYITTVKAW